MAEINERPLPESAAPTSQPERTCIVTRVAYPKEALLRFVVAPDGRVVVDVDGKLPGRGMYIRCSRLTLAEAIARKSFPRAAEQAVTVPEDFLNQVQGQLEKRVGNALSLARKAGQVISGFEKVDDAVKTGRVAALIHATEAAEDGVKKLRDDEIPTFRELPQLLLNPILGRDNAIHAAVLHGPAAAFFIHEARRFALFME